MAVEEHKYINSGTASSVPLPSCLFVLLLFRHRAYRSRGLAGTTRTVLLTVVHLKCNRRYTWYNGGRSETLEVFEAVTIALLLID